MKHFTKAIQKYDTCITLKYLSYKYYMKYLHTITPTAEIPTFSRLPTGVGTTCTTF